jgi:hypothetical protein
VPATARRNDARQSAHIFNIGAMQGKKGAANAAARKNATAIARCEKRAPTAHTGESRMRYWAMKLYVAPRIAFNDFTP